MRESLTIINQIAPMSSHDGPGMRTTVFLKGCPLRCRWCHNPETWSLKREIQWDENSCIGCGTCIKTCPNGAFSLEESYIYDSSKCKLCGKCVENCPSKALSFVGDYYSVDSLYDELIKDVDLIKALNGGITFSGGEPALQYKFINKVISKLKPFGLHIALDTCGHVPFENYELLLPDLDLILFDIKEIDSEKHKEFTNVGNELILSNLILIDKYIKEHDLSTKIWIRTPLIPTMTATEENISGIAHFLKEKDLKSVERWDMCAFNNLCAGKYKKKGINWPLSNLPLLDSMELEEYKNIAINILQKMMLVDCSGLTSRK